MLIDATHWKWAAATALLAGIATAIYVPYHRDALNGPSGGTWEGLGFGIAAAALMLFAGLLGVRKRFPTLRVGRAAFWMKGHVWLGLLSGLLVLYHSGFQLGGTLTTVLVLLAGAILATGIFGVVVQHILPRTMTLRVPLETIYEQIPHVLEQLKKDADELVTRLCGPLGLDQEAGSAKGPAAAAVAAAAVGTAAGAGAGAGAHGGEDPHALRMRVTRRSIAAASAPSEGSGPLADFYVQEMRPYLRDEKSARRGRLATEVRARAIFEHLRNVLPPAIHGAVATFEVLCEERRQLAAQVRLHHWMNGWLLVHVPLSTALLVLGAVHAVMALRY